MSHLVPGPRNLITDVDGLKVGNAVDAKAWSGTTIVVPDERAVAGAEVRGGAPGTRETNVLDPSCRVDAIDAIVLSGGSVFGLDAADGGRGRIAVGMAADITVFDPATVAPGPLRRIRDFPADGERRTADQPVGMRHTPVNGVPIRVDGAGDADGLGRTPGTVLRS